MPLNSDKIYGDLINKQQKIIDQLTEMVKLLGGVNAEISKAGGIKDLSKSTKKLNEVTSKFNDNQNKLARNTKILTDIKKTKAKQTDLETKAGKKLLTEQRKLSKARADATKKIDKQIGRQNRLTKSMKNGILQAGAMYLSFRAIIGVFKNIIGISANFEKQMDKVQAITGASADEMKALKDSAKDLGSRTTKTAAEVGTLQEELSKLGFTTKELLAGTSGILALSEATGSDLAQAATVAGGTIRAFNLDASEANRVVDVMTKSFSSSALDISKFQTAMGSVAPVANAAGISLERTTAQLGTLVDANIDASTAGTSLRNIYLELAKSGMTYDEALDEINNSTNKNSTALALFGKRGVAAGIVLAKNKEKVNELTEAFENSAGTAQEMADIMRDNLAGDIAIAKSAWEGLVLSFDDGGGVLSTVLRGTIQLVTTLLTELRKLNQSQEDKLLAETLGEAQENANNFLMTLKELSREDAIVKINEKLLSLKETIEVTNEIYDEFNRREKHYADVSIASMTNEIEVLQISLEAKQEAIDKELEAKQEAINKTIEANEELTKEEKAKLRERQKDWEEFYEIVNEMRLEQHVRNFMLQESEEEEFIASLDRQVQANAEALDKNVAAFNKSIEDKKLKQKAFFELSDNLVLSSFDFASSLYNRDIELTQRKIDKKEISEKEGAIEIAKIQRKQAILEKTAALFGIAVNTPLAAVKVTAQTGVGAVIAIPLVIASGALQAASVLAQPLPEIPSFFKGSDGKKVSGLAEVHGKEKIDTKDGTFYTNWNKYEGKIIDLPESKITSNEDIIQSDLNNIVNQGNAIDFKGGISKDEFEKIMDNNAKKLDKSIRNMPRDIYQGLTKQGVIEGNNINTYRDRRFRHVGR